MMVLATLGLLLLLLPGLTRAASEPALALHKDGDWTVESRSGKWRFEGVNPPITVQELVANGSDLLYRYGERDYASLHSEAWTWSCEFNLPPSFTAAQKQAGLLLRLEAVDAIASVRLNNASLGRIVSAHRPHIYDASRALVEGRNLLVLELESPVGYAAAQAAAYPYEVPATQQVGALPHYNFIRKAASDFGWDWGPAYAPSGVVGGVWLSAYSSPFLTGINMRQQHHPNKSITVSVDAFLHPTAAPSTGTLSATISNSAGKQLWSGKAHVEVPPCHTAEPSSAGACECSAAAGTAGAAGGPAGCSCKGSGSKVAAGSVTGGPLGSCVGEEGGLGAVQRSVDVLVTPPFDLWWPHEFGGQPLYQLRLHFAPDGTSRSKASAGQASWSKAATSTLDRRIGFRTVELVQEPVLENGTAVGETFLFRVNGLPLYAKGANVIPSDILETRVTPHSLRQLVMDAKAAHMNMLRVWGGGRYFQDAFYDACDEAGVLVWQEAMFACAMYPRDDPFLQEVRAEVGYQVSRLSHHASLVLWGGNNENENAFPWFEASRSVPQLYAVDYNKLFVETIREAVLDLDPGMIYLDTSPSNGLFSKDPFVKRWGNVNDPAFGDVHFYNYEADALEPKTFPPAKFVSEFGYMSFPSFAEYKKVTEQQDWAIDSPMTEFRMRHGNGVEELMAQLQRHFLPSGAKESDTSGSGPANTSSAHFEAFVYLTQVQQALVYQTAVTRWRRLKSDPVARQAGVLYWQLNDIWQGPSWSGLNYNGAWKLLHHAARSFFQPVLASVLVEKQGGGRLEVHVTNDLSVEVQGELTIDAIPYQATHPDNVTRLAHSSSVSIGPFGSGSVWNASLSGWLLPSLGAKLGGPADAAGGAAAGVRRGGHSGGRPKADPASFFLRVQFCPTGVTPSGLYNPFGMGNLAGASTPLIRLPFTDPEVGSKLGSGAGAAAGSPCSSAAGGSGGSGGAASSSVDKEGCAEAAQRMLQCSQSFAFLTEFKNAALAPAEVAVASVEWADEAALLAGGSGSSSSSSGGRGTRSSPGAAQAAALRSIAAGGSAGVIAVRLEARHLPLFVTLESSMAGVFLQNGLPMLPWEPGTVHFVLREGPCSVHGGHSVAGAAAAKKCSPADRAALLARFKEGLTVRWLQQAMQVMRPPAQEGKAAGSAGAGEGTGMQEKQTAGKQQQQVPLLQQALEKAQLGATEAPLVYKLGWEQEDAKVGLAGKEGSSLAAALQAEQPQRAPERQGRETQRHAQPLAALAKQVACVAGLGLAAGLLARLVAQVWHSGQLKARRS